MAEDDFTLQHGDPCAPTLQAYKQYLTPLVDDYWQVNRYEAYAPDLSRWQQCCPGSASAVAGLRPDKAVLPSLDDIPLPAVFGEGAPCARAIHDQGFLPFPEQVSSGCMTTAGNGKPIGASSMLPPATSSTAAAWITLTPAWKRPAGKVLPEARRPKLRQHACGAIRRIVSSW